LLDCFTKILYSLVVDIYFHCRKPLIKHCLTGNPKLQMFTIFIDGVQSP
jgi:hypothetical protein